MFSTSVERVRRLLAVNSQTFEELGLLLFFLYNKYILIDEEEIDNPKIKKNKRNKDEDKDKDEYE